MKWLESILSWHNKVTSFCALLCVNLLYALLFIFGKTFLSVFCYSAVLVIVAGLLLKGTPPNNNNKQTSLPSTGRGEAIVTSAGGSGGCKNCTLSYLASACLFSGGLTDSNVEIVSYKRIEDMLFCAYEFVNKSASISRDILLWRDPIASTKIGALLWCVGYLAGWLSFAQLSFVGLWVIMCGSIVRDLLYVQHIKPILCPHSQVLIKKVTDLVDVIPRMKTYKKH
eukprot:GHVS01008219.1.p1 GENE.GHVS01008219.1~~GHVS01008219.1.p1  ORF type:complete len:226 (+),score=22.85 GHVS01008219.1:181-858(+)